MAAIRLAPDAETMIRSLVEWESVEHVSFTAHTQERKRTHSCIHVCIKSQMKGAAANVVFGVLARLPDGNVPVKKVRFVSGMPVCEKFAGLY